MYALTYSSDGTRLTAVGLGGYDLTTCTRNVTSVSRPMPASCQAGHTNLDGAITFTPGGTAIVGPDPQGANKPSNTLSIWPPLPT
jgi:hypothetical protein